MNKLLKFSEKNSFDIIFENTLITNFRIEGNKPKCQIECPICRKKYTTYYTTYWNATNFQKHLATHFEVELIHAIESGEIQQTGTRETVFLLANSDDIDAISE